MRRRWKNRGEENESEIDSEIDDLFGATQDATKGAINLSIYSVVH